MRNIILFAMLVVAACQQQQRTAETWKKHCAATAQIRADRHMMNSPYRQGVGGYDAEAMKRKIEEQCLKRLQREQNLPSHNTRF